MNTQASGSDKQAFIPSDLDEYGLTQAQFRIYCHVCRRGECFATVETISETCLMHPDTVRKSLKFLLGRNMITATPNPGKKMGTTYRATPIRSWAPRLERPELGPGRPVVADIDPSETKVGHPSETKVGHPSETKVGHPSETKVGKGNPIKVIPSSVSKEGGGTPALSVAERITREGELKMVQRRIEDLRIDDPTWPALQQRQAVLIQILGYDPSIVTKPKKGASFRA